MLPFDPGLFNDDLVDIERGFMKTRLIFGTVAQTNASPGWSALGIYAINVTVEGTTYKYVTVVGSSVEIAVGQKVALLQFTDGTLLALGRVA